MSTVPVLAKVRLMLVMPVVALFRKVPALLNWEAPPRSLEKAWSFRTSKTAPARLLNAASLPLLMFPTPLQVVVPRLSMVRVANNLLLAPLMLRRPLSGMVTLPVPLMVPPVQSSWPPAAMVRSPGPFRVPPTTSRFSAVAAPPMVSVPPLTSVVPAPVTVAPVLSVKVLEGNCSVAPVATSNSPLLDPPVV